MAERIKFIGSKYKIHEVAVSNKLGLFLVMIK